MSDTQESPPVTYTIDANTSAKAVFKVSGAPLTSQRPVSLEILPETVDLHAWLFEDNSGVLCWRINLAIVHGPWKTNQGDMSETRSDLAFVRPLNEYTDDAPEWLRTICIAWLNQLNGLITKEG